MELSRYARLALSIQFSIRQGETNVETREVLAVGVKGVVVELNELLCCRVQLDHPSLLSSATCVLENWLVSEPAAKGDVRATAEKSGGC